MRQLPLFASQSDQPAPTRAEAVRPACGYWAAFQGGGGGKRRGRRQRGWLVTDTPTTETTGRKTARNAPEEV